MKLFIINLVSLALNPQSGDKSNTTFPIVVAVVALVAIVLSVVLNIVLKKPKSDEQIKKDENQEK